MISTLLPSRARTRELRDGGRVVPSRRRQDAPAAVEQLGEACVGAGMLGAGDRVAGDEMDALAADGADRSRDHRALDRADIGDDRAGFNGRRDGLARWRHSAERRGENDEIGAFHGSRRAVVSDVGEVHGLRGFEIRLVSHRDRRCAPPDRARFIARARTSRSARSRERDAVEHGLGLRSCHSPNSASAATTARLALSGPIVMRSASGRP